MGDLIQFNYWFCPDDGRAGYGDLLLRLGMFNSPTVIWEQTNGLHVSDEMNPSVLQSDHVWRVITDDPAQLGLKPCS